MDAAELLALYDSQLRGGAEVADADEVVRIGPLWLATFPARGRGFITHQAIGADELPALVAAAVAHLTADDRVQQVKWKTRGHDALPGLDALLCEHGFVLGEPETVMVGTVEAVVAAGGGLPVGYTLERAGDEAAVREAEALAGRVFGDTGEESSRQADELVARLQRFPGSFEMWLVRDASGVVVCSGRVDFVDGTDFAGLWGGAADVAHRGLGLYRALTAARAHSALARGKRYLQSDCTEHSRPVLQRAGLLPVTTTTPAVWRRPKG